MMLHSLSGVQTIMKYLLLLTFVAFACAAPEADPNAVAEADPKAEADPYYLYGYYGLRHPYYGYGYPYIYGRKKREAEAEPEAEADPKADPWLGYYGLYGGYYGLGHYGYGYPYRYVYYG